jgi:hypothetical protein
MSDVNNDTSAIDQKKEEEESTNSTNYLSKFMKFIISIIVVILIILIYFGVSGLLLYVCKLAQSNILPTEDKCFPYTDNIPEIQKVKTNLFTTFTEPEMSVKLEFPYNEYNSSNVILDKLREYKKSPSSHFLANYFISIIENLIQFNYSIINTIMNMMNEVPEILIIAFGPIIVGFIFAINMLINEIYLIYLWFVNMYWFFKTNKNDTGKGNPEWDDVTLLTPVNWFLGFGIVILFIILFFVGLPLIAFIPFFILLWCGLSSVMYKGIINNKDVNVFTIIKDVLKYYKVSIVTLISVFVVLLAFSTLGAVPGIFSIITVCLIYFGFVSMDIFNPIEISDLSPVVSNKQAKKICSLKNEIKEKHGFLYNLIFGQKGGGNITNQLKKINKYL